MGEHKGSGLAFMCELLAGARELAFSFPDFLPPELGGLDLFTQMVVRPSGGGLRLSNAASLQVLDGGF